MIFRNGTIYVLTHNRQLVQITRGEAKDIGLTIQSLLDALDLDSTALTSWNGRLYLADKNITIEYWPELHQWEISAAAAA